MTARLPIFSMVFAIAYAVLYLLSVQYNWALFTYHPAIEEFGSLVQKPRDGGPAMYWYGWLATSAIGGFVIAAIASWLPSNSINRLWVNLAWAVPLAAMFAFVYILRGYFTK
ncbi:MAG TPA: hypothetical protein VGA27_11015 [Candidatus Binatia bacterium]